MGPIPLLDRYDPPRPETQIHQKINVELNSLVTFNGVFRANYNEHFPHFKWYCVHKTSIKYVYYVSYTTRVKCKPSIPKLQQQIHQNSSIYHYSIMTFSKSS